MTDHEKLLVIGNFLFHEANLLEAQYNRAVQYRFLQKEHVDQLDMLGLIEHFTRLEYFNELCCLLENVLYDRHRSRPAWRPP
jgi:hypothetical protein